MTKKTELTERMRGYLAAIGSRGGKHKKKKTLWVSDSDPLDEGYYAKVLALPMPKGGETEHVMIAHDDWCPKLKGGPCRCDPDVSIQKEPPTEEGPTA